jgi:hypothetical protein
MPFIEAPANFYLGRRYDPNARRVTNDVVYYDARDLTTHAVVVGMTGSGKTGLCISLLEEAILDSIPAIVVDPKGDITNLLLNFPDLRPEDFAPWVNIDDARRAGMEVPAYAADVAHRWREGLGSWGIVSDRMRWLKHVARYTIYTPGSDAGLPISILASLRAPAEGWAGNEEANRERINGVVTALLALIGRSAQPVQDKEHVLIANIFENAWQQGRDLTLEDIILQVQRPPFAKLGVFNVDDYISERTRAKLAMELNNIVAAPSFQTWMNGEPMDIHRLLYTPEGAPRVSILYIAHLSESERQFIITLLLENMLGWMRSQSGTTSLRALLYIDEMFGYFPPYPRNPPTKEPLMRLLKQARAFGLGLILATQNPGDLDYKGLSNAGTWFIGRLQSENDKQKVVTGLASMSNAENEIGLRDVSKLISDVPPRVFLMHNIHDPAGTTMLHTRWAMSYLRGPLTRQQVAQLMAGQKGRFVNAGAAAAPASAPMTFAAQIAAAPPPSTPWYTSTYDSPPPPPSSLPELPPAPPSLPELPSVRPASQPYTAYTAPASDYTQPAPDASQARRTRLPAGFTDIQPPVPSTIAQYFLPTNVSADQAIRNWEQRTNFSAMGFGNARLAYKPALLAQATARFQDRKTQLFTARAFAFLVPEIDRAGIVHWQDHQVPAIDTRRISGEPFAVALFGEVPPALTDAKRLSALRRELSDMVYTIAAIRVPYSSTLNLYGSADGDISQFRAQLQQAARERRDQEMDAITQKYEAALDKLEETKVRKAQRLQSERQEQSERRREELFTTGEAVLGLLRGRTAYTLSRMSRAAVMRKSNKGVIDQVEVELSQLEENQNKIVQEFEAAVRNVNEKWAKVATTIEEQIITPYKKDITVDLFGIGWIPYWYAEINGQPLLLAAM